MRKPWIWLAFTFLLPSLTAATDELSDTPTYFFVVESTIETADVGVWAEAVAETAKAHAKHPEGNDWVAYRRLTGGPAEVVQFLFPLYRLGEMDDWTTSRRILIDVLGKDRGRGVAERLELDATSSDRIVSLNKALSRVPAGYTPHAASYFWVAQVRVAQDRMTEYAALMRRLQRAHDQQQSDLAWLVYGNAVGGPSNEILIFYPFHSFAEIDGWPSRKEILTGAYGPREAARLSAAMDAVAETTKSLWQMEPALSQIGME